MRGVCIALQAVQLESGPLIYFLAAIVCSISAHDR